jgi:hypothetical protein
MKRDTMLLAVLLACLAPACQGTGGGDDDDTATQGADDGGLDAGDGGPDGGADTESASNAGCSNIDLLFIVDDSLSMVEEQTNLVDNFPKFIEVLDAYETPSHAKVDYRVGVTTTGVVRNFKVKTQGVPIAVPASSTGPDGALQGQSMCALGAFPWVEGDDPQVSTKFSCMASVGTNGTGYEMPLAALELALGDDSADGGPNEGFYVNDGSSLLVVIVITDEDDCSIANGGTFGQDNSAQPMGCLESISKGLYDVSDVAGFVGDLTGGGGRSVMVGIGGDQQGGCTSAFGQAIYAKRLKDFVTLFGEYGVFGDVCSGDLQKVLADALATITLTCDDFPPVE